MTWVIVALAAYTIAVALNWRRFYEWLRPSLPVEEPEPSPEEGDPLLSAVMFLSKRVQLAEAFSQSLRRVVAVLVAVILLLAPMSVVSGVGYFQSRGAIHQAKAAAAQAQSAANQALATAEGLIVQRASSRLGLCVAIDDMRMRHNAFVQTSIDERQAIIDETNKNPNLTDQQKADSNAFFQDKIDKYKLDLNEIVDCDDPDQLASLFTKPGG